FNMDLKEFRASGLLELYVIGDLNEADQATVERFLNDYPELKEDVANIENALQLYARANAANPNPNVKNNLLDAVRNQSNNNTTKTEEEETSEVKEKDDEMKDSATTDSEKKEAPKNNSITNDPPKKGGNKWIWPFLASLLAFGAFVAYLWGDGQKKRFESKEQDYINQIDSCSTASQSQQGLLEQYESMLGPNSQIIPIQATGKYPQTDIKLFTNSQTEKNYLKLDLLPPLNPDQSYQLWSLKGTDTPIPLDVFEGNDNIVPITYEAGTDIYAITIEPRGGSQAPTLENLIGTLTI
ncbi:MAG: anti-sigma factor, partial [Bacteroidota bacterium]